MADQQYFAVPVGFCFMMIHLFNQVRGAVCWRGPGRSIGGPLRSGGGEA